MQIIDEMLNNQQVKISGGVATIYVPSTERIYKVRVDEEDVDLLRIMGKSLFVRGDGYVILKPKKPTEPALYLHRVLMCAGAGEMIDHRHGDKLDNRKSMLRTCTPSQNQRAKRKFGKKSLYKGVSLHPGGKYRAKSALMHKQVHLGMFNTAEEAARAYDVYCLRHDTEYHRLNFPNRYNEYLEQIKREDARRDKVE